MKRLYTLLTAILLTNVVWAQAPEKMSYQAVIRGTDNILYTNQDVSCIPSAKSELIRVKL